LLLCSAAMMPAKPSMARRPFRRCSTGRMPGEYNAVSGNPNRLPSHHEALLQGGYGAAGGLIVINEFVGDILLF
jgi:hypothetical protein